MASRPRPQKRKRGLSSAATATPDQRSFIDLASSFFSSSEAEEEELPDLDASWRMEEEDQDEENHLHHRIKKSKKNKKAKNGHRSSKSGGGNGKAVVAHSGPGPLQQQTAKVTAATGTSTSKRSKDKEQNPKGKTTKVKGQKKENGNDRLVSDALECIICLDFAVSPIHNCGNGHITCGTCVSQLAEKKCAMCKARLGISVFGERLAKQLEVKLPCVFLDNGCKELVKSTDMKKHKLSCYYKDVECNLKKLDRGEKCKEVVPIQNYMVHLISHHGSLKASPSPDGGRNLKLRFQIPKSASTLDVYPSTATIPHKDKFFILQSYRTGGNFIAWVTLAGDKAQADKYRYKLTANSVNPSFKKVSLSWSLPVFPLHCGFGFKRPSPLFATIPISTLMTISMDNDSAAAQIDDVFVCQFDIEIQRNVA